MLLLVAWPEKQRLPSWFRPCPLQAGKEGGPQASRAPGSVPVAVLRVSTSEGVSESGSVLVGADVSAGFLFASHASGGVPVPVPVPVPEAVVYRVSMGE